MTEPRPARPSSRRDHDFLKLWSGQTISVFGSLITRTALPFAAILTLHASPLLIGLLAATGIVPDVLLGLVAGAWVDRLRRRPLMIAADLGRAALLLSVPIAWLLGALTIWQLILVAFLTGALTTLFEVAYLAYLPSLVGRDELLAGNSKLAASESVAEAAAFSLGGWLVQLVGAPLAILIDSGSFVVSAASLLAIRRREPPARPAPERAGMPAEIAAGLRLVAHDRWLRTLTGSAMLWGLSMGFGNALYLLFVTRQLGFRPGVLGLIFAVGGVSSLLAAALTPSLTRRLGATRALGTGLALTGLGTVMVLLAPGPTLLGATLLIGQQLVGDSGATLFLVNQKSLVQRAAPEHLLGRVTGTVRFAVLGTTLLGTLLAGGLGQLTGVRAAYFLAPPAEFVAALWLLRLPAAAPEPVGLAPEA